MPADLSGFRLIAAPYDGDLDDGISVFLSLDTSKFSPQQMRAYRRLRTSLIQERGPNESRELGLFEEFVHVADDFDAPLPDEGAFEGAYSDEYGMSLAR